MSEESLGVSIIPQNDAYPESRTPVRKAVNRLLHEKDRGPSAYGAIAIGFVAIMAVTAISAQLTGVVNFLAPFSWIF